MKNTGIELSSPDLLVDLDRYNFSSFVDRLRCFVELLTLPPSTLRSLLRSYIEAGARMFECENGFIGQRIGGVVRIIACESDITNLFEGQLMQVNDPFISAVLDSEGSCPIQSDRFVTNAAHKVSYNGSSVQKLITENLIVHGEFFGMICFFSTQKSRKYNIEDLESISLMAKGVAKMIEEQTSLREQKSEEDSFSTPGVKHFDDYLLEARLPEAYGVAGKVVEVLKTRVGKSPLGIGDVAGELGLSKRTLQRRLQQQEISFAELRDKVRFHYSIDFLIEQNASIDSISTALDFSDRTSFTNAFKRWTGLSPSTFRKLFRDYA
ncbi:helix-turn-helix domain-containing protein [Sessilibacter sp. MAH2]